MARPSSTSLNDQFVKLITRINEQNKFLLVAIIAGLIFVAYYFVFLSGKIKEITTINGEISRKQELLGTTRNNIQRISQYQEELKAFTETEKILSQKIKTAEEIPSALEHLTRVAADYGLRIEQMMPDTNREKVVLKDKEIQYVAVPIILGGKSSYHDFGRFLNAIEREGIFSGIQDFGIFTNSEDVNRHKFKLVLTIMTTEKVEKPEKGAKPGGKK